MKRSPVNRASAKQRHLRDLFGEVPITRADGVAAPGDEGASLGGLRISQRSAASSRAVGAPRQHHLPSAALPAGQRATFCPRQEGVSRRLRLQEKKRVGEFRWIRGMDEALNFGRFFKHVERLKRKFHRDAAMGKHALRNRRSSRVARLAKARLVGVEQLLQRCAAGPAAANDE